MQLKKLYSLLAIFIILSCSNSDDPAEPLRQLQLDRVEEYFDDFLSSTYIIQYDSTSAISSLLIENDDQSTMYRNTVEDGFIENIEIEVLNLGQTYGWAHDIQYFEDETILYERDRNRLMVVKSTGSYLDNIRVYFNTRRDIFFETEFIRDQSNNLMEINLYETNENADFHTELNSLKHVCVLTFQKANPKTSTCYTFCYTQFSQ